MESVEISLSPPMHHRVRDRRTSVSENSPSPNLISRLGRGDPEALREVYERYADDVYRIALRLTGSSADAYDVTHDVFLGLPEAMQRYDPERDFPSWLRGVAVRTAQMSIRTVGRRREVELSALAGLAVGSRRDALVNRLTLERALDQLSPTLRSVVVLRELEGLSYKEIADLLGITESAAAVRLHRARRQLRDILRGNG
jgi:RNA polymerase sigma-70 factor (ECF subfamily)